MRNKKLKERIAAIGNNNNNNNILNGIEVANNIPNSIIREELKECDQLKKPKKHSKACSLCDSSNGKLTMLYCEGYICAKCASLIDNSLTTANYYKCKYCLSYIIGYKEDKNEVFLNEKLGIVFGNEQGNCPICLGEEPTVILPCQNIPFHRVHKECFTELLKKQDVNCPICRGDLVFRT